MVVFLVKNSNEDQFLFESTTAESNDTLIRKLVHIWDTRLQINRLVLGCRGLMTHGPSKPPKEHGIDSVRLSILLALYGWFFFAYSSVANLLPSLTTPLRLFMMVGIRRKWSKNQEGSLLQWRSDRSKNRKPMWSQARRRDRENMRRCTTGNISGKQRIDGETQMIWICFYFLF